MAHEVPPLPYDYKALEPHIDEQTMRIHHDKHHAAYVTNLNAALEKHPNLQPKSIDDLIRGINSVPEEIRTAVRNNGGGHVNHTMFWQIMGPGKGGAPTRRCRGRDQVVIRKLRHVQGAVREGGHDAVRQRLGVAPRRRRQARDREHGEPGQSADGREETYSRPRRVGARVLSQIPESAGPTTSRRGGTRELGRGQ
jgi:hypothetical protein